MSGEEGRTSPPRNVSDQGEINVFLIAVNLITILVSQVHLFF